MSTTQPVSPNVKKMEQDIEKDGKTEEKRVKHIVDDLTSAEKAHAKAKKAAQKAESALGKAETKELAATKAANKATHKRDIAATKRHSAEQDVQMKKQHDLKLQKDLQAKREKADAAIHDQHLHNQVREAKLAELASSARPAAGTEVNATSGGERAS